MGTPGNVCNPLGLVVGEHLLAAEDLNKQLIEVGIVSGATVTVVRLNNSLVYECLDDVDDAGGQYSSSESQVVVSFLGETSLLIRCTTTREWSFRNESFHVTQIYDVCRGTYDLEGDNKDVAVCTWDRCFRKVRSSRTVESAVKTFAADESAWVRRESLPAAWARIHTADGKWSVKHARIVDKNYILGVRICGRRDASDVVSLLSLSGDAN